MRVPAVSNKSIKTNTPIIVRTPNSNAPVKSIFNRVGVKSGGEDITPENSTNPKGMPKRLTTSMPIKIAPVTSRCKRTPIVKTPTRVNTAGRLFRSPN